MHDIGEDMEDDYNEVGIVVADSEIDGWKSRPWVNPETLEIDAEAMQESFDNIHDVFDAGETFETMDRVESLLEAFKKIDENMDAFCRMEAKMYIDVSRKFKQTFLFERKYRTIIDWLHTKTDEEIESILWKCSSGKRIRDVRSDEIKGVRAKKTQEKNQAIVDEHLRIAHLIENEFMETGHTVNNAGRYVELWNTDVSEGPNVEMARGLVEKTKTKIINNNGLGIGDGSGMYISNEILSPAEAMMVVKVRINSILRDIKRLASICKKHDCRVPHEGITLLTEAVNELG